ncbi:unnamed protein product [Onchocerca flexuosa]|uniref:DEAD/DEAH box helicase n=1 Tax=Onchocerca flexuosa TaxID=387005 RepID=A0A183I1M7_9BILA|nr:unnamed protein product [Onchocerca flexuosa]
MRNTKAKVARHNSKNDDKNVTQKRFNSQKNDKDRRSYSDSSEFQGFRLDSSKRSNSRNNSTAQLNSILPHQRQRKE